MRWLIVEDALRDRKGHWFEYITTLCDGLRALGDEVAVLADRRAEPFILKRVGAMPILPESVWHRMNRQTPAVMRYWRVPAHALSTWRVMSKYLARQERADLIFVPTATVHHLLGWSWLLGRLLRKTNSRLLLFFINLPVRVDPASGRAYWINSPTTKLLARMLHRMAPAIRSGRVVLGAEPEPMRSALAELTGLPVVYLPQPVPPVTLEPAAQAETGKDLLLACYGAARAEKGSDCLQLSIRQSLREFPSSRARFAIQWVADFEGSNGQAVVKDPKLLASHRVEYITRFFNNGEYPQWLGRTSALLLPYRLSSYRLRGSRVALEGMVRGIPLLVTAGTSFASQMKRFGAGITCMDGDVASLVSAIRELELRFEELKRLAEARKEMARQHFSVEAFRRMLVEFEPSRAGVQALACLEATGTAQKGLP